MMKPLYMRRFDAMRSASSALQLCRRLFCSLSSCSTSISRVATHDLILLSFLTASQFSRSVRVVLIRDERSASLTSSMLNGGGAEGSSGIGAMLVLFGEVGGDSELRREPMEDERECLLLPEADDAGFVENDENENSGEGDVNEEEGEWFAEDEVLEPGLPDELETFESTDSRRRTLVC
jgi:hypothetical protein